MASDPVLEIPTGENPIAMSGIEFVEFATRNPDAFGSVLANWASPPSPNTAPVRFISIGRAN